MTDLDAFMRLVPILERIDQGAGFCEDRGYGWSIEMEEREGRAVIVQAFADHPRLGVVMPEFAAQIARGLPIGDVGTGRILTRAEAALRQTPVPETAHQ